MPVGGQISIQIIYNSLFPTIQVYLEHVFHTKFNSVFCFWLFAQFLIVILLSEHPVWLLCLLFAVTKHFVT